MEKNKQNIIRILFFIPQLSSGGTEKHLLQLSKYLNKNKFEIHLICTSKMNDDFVFYEEIKLHCKNVLCMPLGLRNLINILKSIKYINMNKIDIVHSFLYGNHYLDFIIFELSKASKYIIVRRNIQHWRKINKIGLLERFRNKRANLVLANSVAAKDVAIRTEGISKDKIKVIYNGIESLEAQTAKDILKINEIKKYINYNNEFIISNIANIKKVKRQEDIIYAMNELINNIKIKNIKLILIGRHDEGYEKGINDLIVKYQLEEYVYILGYLENVRALLCLSNITILSSSAESFPNAILESLQSSVPVIATDVGGNREIIKNGVNGFLYNLGDINQLVDKIKIMANNIHPYRDNCIKTIEGKYDIYKCIEQYQYEYLSLMK